MNWGFKPVNRDTEGWVYDAEIQIQDEWDWNKYDYSTSKKFYLQWKNAFDQFLRLLMGSLAGNEFKELYNADAHDDKSVMLSLEGQRGIYGYLESFPSIYYLIGEKCIPLDMFPEVEVNLGGGQIVNWNKDILKGMQWNSFEEFEKLYDVLDYVNEVMHYEWDGQLWDIMTEYLPKLVEKNPDWGYLYAEYDYEANPQNKYQFQISKWQGPKWEDKEE